MNSRQSFKIINKTHYFDPIRSKAVLSIPSPNSHMALLAKQQGYEMRLYWQFRWCLDHNGQVFYYTLTYNDMSIPIYEGVPCFDYKDLDSFFNGGFRKQLLRKYGTSFKYFVGAELGEGKGSRGFENNPHYHVLFYLQDAKNSKYPYVKINPYSFRSLVRRYWQDYDQDVDPFKDFRTTGYGIAKEGDYIGLVSDFRAVSYVCKYVTKDVTLIKAEKKLSKIFFDRYYHHNYCDERIQNNFLIDFVYPRLGWYDDLPDNYIDFDEICKSYCPNLYKQYGVRLKDWKTFFHSFLSESGLKRDYDNYVSSIVEDYVRQDINLFRNRFSNKCRISQGVGLYALDFMDKPTLTIPVPTKEGYEMRSINLYYYRKLYYNVEKDVIGNNVYVLSDKGIDLKVKNLERSVTRLTDRLDSYYKLLSSEVFEDMKNSGLIHNVQCSFVTFQMNLELIIKYLKSNLKHIFEIYAFFKLVYEGRFFKIVRDGRDKSIIYPSIDYFTDYRRFLKPSYFTANYDPDGVSYFIKNFGEDYLSYDTHPFFRPFNSLFAVFDLLVDYFFTNKDAEVERVYKEVREIKKFHVKLKLKPYYTNLFN